MDTAMDMVMEEKGMANKKGLFILASALLLSGCGNSELEITKNDILEVARDDANATKKECSNVNVQEEKKYYTVTFDTKSGSYEYKIGKDGIIQDRNYKRTGDGEKLETTSSAVPPETKKEEIKTEANAELKKEETENEKKKSEPSFDENQQQAGIPPRHVRPADRRRGFLERLRELCEFRHLAAQRPTHVPLHRTALRPRRAS